MRTSRIVSPIPPLRPQKVTALHALAHHRQLVQTRQCQANNAEQNQTSGSRSNPSTCDSDNALSLHDAREHSINGEAVVWLSRATKHEAIELCCPFLDVCCVSLGALILSLPGDGWVRSGPRVCPKFVCRHGLVRGWSCSWGNEGRDTRKDGGREVVEGARGAFLSLMASPACNSAHTFRAVVGTNTASS